MRRFVSLVTLFSLCLGVMPAQEKNNVIYPRGTAPAGAPGSGEGGPTNTFLLLGTAALAAAAGWWLWQKRRTGAQGPTGSRLAIVESRSLGSRQYLVVADYDGRKFLLGVCPGSIELLTPLDGQQPPAQS